MADTAIHRERTAIRRNSLSSPTAAAMHDQLITKNSTVLNFGCGYNEDSHRLCAEGIAARGWDRHFTPHATLNAADVVLLNFVINTIEHRAERETTVLIAYALAVKVLVLSVRTDNRGWRGKVATYNDGVFTELETFQKIYTHDEFCQTIANTLRKPVHGVKSGIAYAFRDSAAEAAYLTRYPNRRRKLWYPETALSTKP